MVSTSNQADVVDLNIIPSNLLARADVVTGGASAAYGSGAMAGVVNLVLDRRRQGISLDMDYGFNEAGDGGNPHVALSGGTSLFEGRGHALLGLVEAGRTRDEAYRLVQAAAMRAWDGEGTLQDLLAADPDLGVDPATLAGWFDPARVIEGTGVVFDRLSGLALE